MKGLIAIVAVLGAGAGLAYLFDPDQGRRRRALLRDKAVAVTNSMEQELEGKLRHWSNRARGLAAEARDFVERDHRAPGSGAASTSV